MFCMVMRFAVFSLMIMLGMAVIGAFILMPMHFMDLALVVMSLLRMRMIAGGRRFARRIIAV
jgi:hypothetical protein